MLDLALSDEQEAMRASFARFLSDKCRPERVRKAEPLGFDPDLWSEAVALGATGIGVNGSVGGGGGGILDAAVAIKEFGACLAPIPIIESLVTSRLLAGLDDDRPRARASATVTGSVGTLVLHPSPTERTLVPAGAIAESVVVFDGEDLRLTDQSGSHSAPANLGCQPLDWYHAGTNDTVVASGAAADRAFATAVNEWKLLTAAALVGLGSEALAMACDYARERHQFGVPIGAFQSIAHALADNATALDGAELLVYEAAWARDQARVDADALASKAFLFAAESARRVVADALHVHGGYGFMLEYDVQLYFRRAKAWPLVYSDLRTEYQRAADMSWGHDGHVT